MQLASHRQTSAPLSGLMTLWDILGAASLQGNTKICLDAGDAASWPGSGQKWLDRSGAGIDFFLGASGSAASDDPTFVGTVGDLTTATYWSLDGGDYFRYDSANEAFMEAWHKDNALFTAIGLIYRTGSGDFPIVGGPAGAHNGIGFGLAPDGKPFIYVESSGAGAPLFATADAGLANGWHLVALSLNEAAGGGGSFLYGDGAYLPVSSSNTFNGTYSSPSSGAASDTYNLFNGWSGGQSPAVNGSRVMGLAVLDKACSKSELDAVFDLARKRLGI